MDQRDGKTWTPLEYMRTFAFNFHILLNPPFGFGICFGLAYPFLLPPPDHYAVYSSKGIGWVVITSILTAPGTILVIPLLISFSLRKGWMRPVSDEALRRSWVWKYLFPIVYCRNQLLSGILSAIMQTTFAPWIWLGIMYAVYGDAKVVTPVGFSLWLSLFCSILTVPSAYLGLICGSSETALEVYESGLWRAYLDLSDFGNFYRFIKKKFS